MINRHEKFLSPKTLDVVHVLMKFVAQLVEQGRGMLQAGSASSAIRPRNCCPVRQLPMDGEAGLLGSRGEILTSADYRARQPLLCLQIREFLVAHRW